MESNEELEQLDLVNMGSGNVFEDLGFANADEMLTKAKIASAIHDVLRERGLTQKQAADVMDIDQPKVSKILKGKLGEFSTEWLLSRLLRLGLDVDIVIHTGTPRQAGRGAIKVARA